MNALEPEQLIHTGARDRMRASAYAAFADSILSTIFEFNCAHYFVPLLAVHRAWLTMLAERGIVDQAKAVAVLRGLDAAEAAGPDSVRPFDPAVEYYYYLHTERALVAGVPGEEAIIGDLSLGRTCPEPLSGRVVRASLPHVLTLVLDLRPGPRSFVEQHASVGTTARNEVRHMTRERQERSAVDHLTVEARKQALREGEIMLSEAVGEVIAA